MRRSRWISAVVSLLLALVVLAGCSDDDPVEVAELSDGSERSSTTSTVDADKPGSTSTSELGEPEGEDESSADPEVCAAFQAIADADDEFEREMNGMLAPVLAAAEAGDQVAADEAADAVAVQMQVMLADFLPDVLGAYDHLAVVAPNLADDVTIVRDFTDEVGRALANAGGSLDEFNQAVEEVAGPGAIVAASATLRLDEVSRTQCGIVIAN